MSVTNQYRATILKLKQRVRELEQKERQGRKKLQQTMLHARKLAKTYQARLNVKVREMKGKSALDTAAAYTRAAVDLERRMLKEAEKKGRALASAVVKMDKAHISRLVKGFACKPRPPRKKK